MTTGQAINTFVKETGGWVASQLEACTRCGMCAEACHFYQATGNPEYAPVWKLELLRRAYEQRFTLTGKLKLALRVESAIADDDLLRWSRINYYACTLCNKCAMVCPMGIQIGPLLHEVRTALSQAGVVPADLMTAVQKQVDEGSPLGVTDQVFDDRMEWIADEWEVELPMDVKGADTLVVFTSIEIMKFPANIAAIATILNKAGERWTMSKKGREVVNFGFFEGNEARTKLFLSRIFDAAKELGVKRVLVTECGHAYDALRWTAANLMDVPPELEIVHIAGIMGEYLRSGRIKLKEGAYDNGTLTFHDACKIQRRGGHIQEPREILKVLAPHSFKEMTPNREQAICCGGGGGVIAIKDADPVRYAVFQELKARQLKEVGADTVTMVCSNCRLQFTDCVQHFNLDVKVRGLSEMVADALVD
jgi:Fe-S oxidoreductase